MSAYKPLVKAISEAVAADYPRLVFADGTIGAWFDPSDLNTLFQDSEGRTPVTTDGDPVGLMLDRARGLRLGSELITNGSFDSDLSGWTAGADWAWVSGAAVDGGTASAPDADLTQTITTTAGAWYKVTFDASALSGSPVIIFDGVTRSTFGEGAQSYILQASTTSTDLTFRGGGATYTIDNVSVRQLKGQHAYQSTTSRKPLYKAAGALHWLEFDGVDDYLSLDSGLGFVVDQDMTVIAGISAAVVETDKRIFGFGPVSGAPGISVGTDGWSWRFNDGNCRFPAPANGSTHVGSWWRSTGETYNQSHFAEDGNELTLTGSGSGSNLPTSAPDTLYLGTHNTSSLFYDGKLYGFLISGAVYSQADRFQLERWFAKKAGMSL